MNSILFSLSTVGPVFLIIAIGALMRRVRLIDGEISGQMSRLVFHLFLPALLFKALVNADFSSLLSWRLLLTVWVILFTSFFAARVLAILFRIDRDDRGMFASGATWGNVAIVGYALGEALYGEAGLARAAVFSAMVLPLHNPIGFLAMDKHLKATNRREFLPAMLKRIFTNPLLLTIMLGLALNLVLGALGWRMPPVVMDVLDILARASLPLALVAIGGNLEFGRQGAGIALSVGAAFIKLLLMPLIAFGLTALVNLDEGWRGSIIIGFSCPTAVSFFVISRNLGYDGYKGAAIVTATTVGAALSVGLVAIILRSVGLV